MSQLRHAVRSRAIKYPDDDGEPMSDNTLQFKWIVLIKENLESLFASDPNIFVAGNHLWYAVKGKPELRAAPDVMVVFGRPKRHRRSYMQWKEGGVAPQVVFEILSPGNRRLEMERKCRFYDRFQVEEYFIHDPDSGAIKGFVRESTGLVPVLEMNGFESPRLGIRFHPGRGKDNLVILGPDGAPFLTYQEIQAERRAEAERAREADERAREADAIARKERSRAEQEQAKARHEHERAEHEKAKARHEHERAEAEQAKARHEHERAEYEKAKAERLAARLRALGVDPD